MNKTNETTRLSTETTTDETTILTVDTTELDTVTGGCAKCGCASPDPTASIAALAASWRR